MNPPKLPEEGARTSLFDAETFELRQRTKLVELTGEYDIVGPGGYVLGSIQEKATGRGPKFVRVLIGEGLLRRKMRVLDVEGRPVAEIERNRGIIRPVVTVTVKDARVGQVRFSLMSKWVTFLGRRHELLDGSGRTVGHLVTHGLRRRSFRVLIDGAQVAEFRQLWNGVVRESVTSADRFAFSRTAAVRADLRPLVFAVPLAAELAFKQGGNPTLLGAASDVADLFG